MRDEVIERIARAAHGYYVDQRLYLQRLPCDWDGCPENPYVRAQFRDYEEQCRQAWRNLVAFVGDQARGETEE